MPIPEMIGKKFGRFTILKRVKNATGSRRSRWLCLCECGNNHITTGELLRNGGSKSCGCLKIEAGYKKGKEKFKHGHTIGGRTKEYSIWKGIRSRCFNKNSKAYPNYGGRGIIICDKWKNDFKAFLGDMGRIPKDKSSIDRINNNGNYEPGNCRWSTPLEQNRNKRLSKLNKSGVSGVTWYKLRSQWVSKLYIQDKRIHLGYFDRKEDAIQAKKEAEKKLLIPNSPIT